MWVQVRLWLEARSTDPSVADDELERTTREIAQAIVQTLSNRAFGRPEMTLSDPYASAREQRAFDRETVERYRETIAPEVEEVRAEYVARGLWTDDLDALYREPRTIADLRTLVIELGTLAAELG